MQIAKILKFIIGDKSKKLQIWSIPYFKNKESLGDALRSSF